MNAFRKDIRDPRYQSNTHKPIDADRLSEIESNTPVVTKGRTGKRKVPRYRKSRVYSGSCEWAVMKKKRRLVIAKTAKFRICSPLERIES